MQSPTATGAVAIVVTGVKTCPLEQRRDCSDEARSSLARDREFLLAEAGIIEQAPPKNSLCIRASPVDFFIGLWEKSFASRREVSVAGECFFVIERDGPPGSGARIASNSSRKVLPVRASEPRSTLKKSDLFPRSGGFERGALRPKNFDKRHRQAPISICPE